MTVSYSMNYYEILSVDPTAKLDAIREAYKKLALKIHPDRALINKSMTGAEEPSSSSTGGPSCQANDADFGDQTGSSAVGEGGGDRGEGEASGARSGSSSAGVTNQTNSGGAGDGGAGNKRGKINIEFYQVQDAWKTLSNPSRRFLYDMRTFGSSTEFPECDESYLLDLERAQAEKDLVSMATYLQKVVRRETKAKGVIIMDAW